MGDLASSVEQAWQAVGSWWGGVELWLTQLWLGFQVALLIAVLLPACWLVATGIDRGLDRITRRIGRH